MCLVISLTCMDTHNSIRIESVHEEMRPGVFYYFPPPKKKNCSCKILRSQGSNGERERRNRRRWMTPRGTLEAFIFVRDSSDRISSIPSISSTPFLVPFLFRVPARRDSIRNFAHSATLQ